MLEALEDVCYILEGKKDGLAVDGRSLVISGYGSALLALSSPPRKTGWVSPAARLQMFEELSKRSANFALSYPAPPVSVILG